MSRGITAGQYKKNIQDEKNKVLRFVRDLQNAVALTITLQGQKVSTIPGGATPDAIDEWCDEALLGHDLFSIEFQKAVKALFDARAASLDRIKTLAAAAKADLGADVLLLNIAS